MPAGLIDDLTYEIIRGLPPFSQQTVVETWRVPGVDGYGAMTLGLGDAEFDLIAMAFVNTTVLGSVNDDANSLIEDTVALQGTIVPITDNYGNVTPGILLEKVDARQKDTKIPLINYKGGPAILVTIRIRGVLA